jgi:outer membrane protein
MKKTTGALVGALLLASNAYAAPGDMIVRVRAVDINFQNSADTSALAAVTAANKTIPEADVSYFFTDNIAAELILTYPQKITVNPNIGSLDALPPTLTLQYHFMPDNPSFRPYIGAGINYTNFSSVNLAGGTLNSSNSSTGGALQIGFDVPISGNMSFNFDVKKVYMKTTITSAASGATVGTLTLNPYLIGAGLGWKF